MKWGKMRAIKVSPKEYANAVMKKAEHGEYVKIPSSKGFIFWGLMMPGGAWVAWPNTQDEDPVDGLTQEEMDLYKEKYGTIPDLFSARHRYRANHKEA